MRQMESEAVPTATGSRRFDAMRHADPLLVALGYCSTEVPAYLPIGPVTSGTDDGFEVYAFVAYSVAIVIVIGGAALLGSVQRWR